MVMLVKKILRDFFWNFSYLLNSKPISPNRRMTIVTAADSTHEKSLGNLLDSITIHAPQAHVLIWDLGLSLNQRKILEEKFRSYAFKDFNFDLYPSYFNIKIDSGQYAWKPVIISESAKLLEGFLLWLDAGNKLIGKLDKVKKLINKNGLYSPYSGGNIKAFTHKSTLDYFSFPARKLLKRNCNGAIIGFKLASPCVAGLIDDWKNCALNKDCIAPYGSNRENHRQDQSVLTILCELKGMNKTKIYRNLNSRINILIHQDVELEK